MTIRILYVDDDSDRLLDVKSAVEAGNDAIQQDQIRNWRPMIVDTVQGPEDVSAALKSKDYDLILADVFFPIQKTKKRAADEKDRLNEILSAAERWRKNNGLERALPIIAYTAYGKEALESLLGRRQSLYDIWDKATASAAYVAWRLNRITMELYRTNPDPLMGRLIRRMPTVGGVPWHSTVTEMTRRYANGWTERDQIKAVQEPLNEIASQIDGTDTIDKCWETMAAWEPLSRAVSPNVRGHARHVLHVFWLGYYLLHHEALCEWFAKAWKAIVADRWKKGLVDDVPPIEALSNVWFYAALGHDVAGCVQEFLAVGEKMHVVLDPFNSLVTENRAVLNTSEQLQSRSADLFKKVSKLKALHQALVPLWEESISTSSSHPDHGVVAGAFLTSKLELSGKGNCYAQEAARAMMIHNLLGRLKSEPKPLLSWKLDPLVCLLVLCDQLQAWDRDRGDTAKGDEVTVTHAELSALEITKAAGKSSILIAIDYFAPEYLDHSQMLFDVFKDKFQKILRNNPLRALKRITDWPFTFEARCSLNGVPLNVPFRFPLAFSRTN